MTLWIIIIFMTLAASLAVLRPLIRAPGRTAPAASHDMEVYRDQLAELERDRDRGLISEKDAEEARAEIGRRLLKADAENKKADTEARSGSTRLIALAAVLSIPLVSWGFYASLGSPDMPDQPLVARMTKPPQQNTVTELIARAESHLERNPDDAEGWAVLAPIYMRTGRFPDAVTAWRRVIALKGEDASRLTGLGEALGAAGGGLVNGDSLAAFNAALKLDPADEKARFFVAVGDAQAGKLEEARARWQAIVDGAKSDSPWKEAALSAIETSKRGQQQAAQAPAASQPVAPSAPGPTAEQVEAAKDMTAQDRQAMIEGMVAQLDAKLNDNPGDIDGWMRLIRAYSVMGKKEEAGSALTRARDALKGEPEKLAAVDAFAGQLGLPAADARN